MRILYILTKRGSERLVRDEACLILVDNVELLVLQEPLCVVLVPLHVADALVNLTLSLGQGLAHFLHNKGSVGCLVLLENFLQEAQFLEAALEARVTLRVLVPESLVRPVDMAIKLLVGYGFKSAMKLPVFGVYRTECDAHIDLIISYL